MLLRAGEVPGVQVWAGGLLSHEVGRAVSHHLECSVTNILAEYHGESGDNAVHRLGQHEEAIKRKDKKNASTKILSFGLLVPEKNRFQNFNLAYKILTKTQ